MPDDPQPDEPKSQEGTGQERATLTATEEVGTRQVPTVPPTGKREAFRAVRRQLSDEELQGAGAIKVILDDLYQAESRCEVLESYVDLYHEADKEAAVAKERLKPQTANEILFSVMLTVGGVIIGLSPSISTWHHAGGYAVLLGIALIVGAVIARIFR